MAPFEEEFEYEELEDTTKDFIIKNQTWVENVTYVPSANEFENLEYEDNENVTDKYFEVIDKPNVNKKKPQINVVILGEVDDKDKTSTSTETSHKLVVLEQHDENGYNNITISQNITLFYKTNDEKAVDLN